MAKPQIVVDITSDTIWPWCFVGKKRFEVATLSFKDEVDFKVTWKPFFLNPNTPEAGIPLVDYLSSRYGPEAGQRAVQKVGPLHTAAAELGISFTTDRRVVNTMKSHCLLEFAKSAAKQNQVAQALFKIYFEQGKDINSDEVLLQVAEETGLDKQGLKECLVAPQMHNNIKEEVRHAQIKGIHGVPFFEIYADGVNDTNPISFSGAQGTEVFVDVFNRVLAALKSKVQVLQGEKLICWILCCF